MPLKSMSQAADADVFQTVADVFNPWARVGEVEAHQTFEAWVVYVTGGQEFAVAVEELGGIGSSVAMRRWGIGLVFKSGSCAAALPVETTFKTQANVEMAFETAGLAARATFTCGQDAAPLLRRSYAVNGGQR